MRTIFKISDIHVGSELIYEGLASGPTKWVVVAIRPRSSFKKRSSVDRGDDLVFIERDGSKNSLTASYVASSARWKLGG